MQFSRRSTILQDAKHKQDQEYRVCWAGVGALAHTRRDRRALLGAIPIMATVPWVPAAVLLLALALIGASVAASARNISCIRFEDDLLPEPQAAGVLVGGGARGRVLTHFDYGEYAIWHLSPDLLVSIDGRRETVYSDEVDERQFRFYTEPGDRKKIVNELKPDYIWMPSSLNITQDLATDGWKPIYSGPRSVILSRRTFSVPLYSSDASPRCFPGP